LTNAGGEGVWKELLLRPTPSVRRILIAAIGLQFFQHSSGIDALLLYSPTIFKAAAVHNNKLMLATSGIGITRIIIMLIATCLVDKVGRRPLLLISSGGMLLPLVGLGFGLSIMNHSKEKLLWANFSIVATYIFMGMHSIGLGTVTWVYSSEIFPLKLRAQGASIVVAVSGGMNAQGFFTFAQL
jgi:MFS family permease